MELNLLKTLIESSTRNEKLQGTRGLRTVLSQENPPIDAIIR